MVLQSSGYSTGFFHAPAEPFHKPSKKPTLVNVGGNGDCGFRAIAAGLIDNFLTHSRVNKDVLAKVLAQHFIFFPEHRPSLPGLVTPAERLDHVIKHVRLGELLQSLAYTLRQMSVTYMCEHPHRFRGPFVAHNEGTTPAEMRKPTTWIDETCIAALAEELQMPIEVEVVSRVKTLPMRLTYNDTETEHTPLVMQLENGHYIPRVVHTELFTGAQTQPVRAISPVSEALPADRSLADIHAEIAQEDKRLIDAFEETQHCLTTMVIAGELSKNDLLKMYIKGMSSSDYLTGRVKYVGIEHGNQHFFDAIVSTQRGVEPKALPTADEAIVSELIHALARAISIGQMNADQLFAHVEDSVSSSNAKKLLG